MPPTGSSVPAVCRDRSDRSRPVALRSEAPPGPAAADRAWGPAVCARRQAARSARVPPDPGRRPQPGLPAARDRGQRTPRIWRCAIPAAHRVRAHSLKEWPHLGPRRHRATPGPLVAGRLGRQRVGAPGQAQTPEQALEATQPPLHAHFQRGHPPLQSTQAPLHAPLARHNKACERHAHTQNADQFSAHSISVPPAQNQVPGQGWQWLYYSMLFTSLRVTPASVAAVVRCGRKSLSATCARGAGRTVAGTMLLPIRHRPAADSADADTARARRAYCQFTIRLGTSHAPHGIEPVGRRKRSVGSKPASRAPFRSAAPTGGG